MMILLEVFVLVVFGVPAVFLSAQYILGNKSTSVLANTSDRMPCSILIPAHNESEIIAGTLQKLQSQITKDDCILVVADNCDDDTADIARSFGVDVVERADLASCGKGYALDAGLIEIKKKPTETVVIFDADCEFAPDGLNKLVSKSQVTGRVIQGLYLMKAPENAPLKSRLAEFAWMVKNKIRPIGQRRLGLGCQLQGSGMAFPMTILDSVSLASGSIVEDLELGLTLTELGLKPEFDDNAVILSEFPSSEEALNTQRTRWEHGHMSIITSLVPRFINSLCRIRGRTAAMTLDAMIPPTVLWLLLSTFLFVVIGLFSFFVEFRWLIFYIPVYLLQIFSLFLVWFVHGRNIFGMKDIDGIVQYILDKAPLYRRFIVQREKSWVRTDRNKV